MCLLPVVNLACTFRYEPNKYVQPRRVTLACVSSPPFPACCNTNTRTVQTQRVPHVYLRGRWQLVDYVASTLTMLHLHTISPVVQTYTCLSHIFLICSKEKLKEVHVTAGAGAGDPLCTPRAQTFQRWHYGCAFSFLGSETSQVLSHSSIVYEWRAQVLKTPVAAASPSTLHPEETHLYFTTHTCLLSLSLSPCGGKCVCVCVVGGKGGRRRRSCVLN